ncbi:MAG TPA: transposase [Anaerolineales bacterium]|nr:transposase [Anaerolineales bacterium]
MDETRGRKPTRLKGYDYSTPGTYFVTICTFHRECLFGEVDGDKIQLNPIGKLVEKIWFGLPRQFLHIKADHFVVMPNHVHGLIEIMPNEIKSRHGLSDIMNGYKSRTTRLVNRIRDTKGVPLWQRSFYDRIIRDEKQLLTVIEYIRQNPSRWMEDEENIWK